MDRSIRRLPDPALLPPGGERRRTVRQKLHTPVYVSFQSPQSGMVLDLNELLDLHENGFAVQTAVPTESERTVRLEVNHALPLRLDLTETKNYVDGTGQVMWIDNAGRAGIRFSSLPGRSRQILKEWLFANLLIASTDYASRSKQFARRQREESSAVPSTGRASANEASPPDSSPDDQLRAPTPKLVANPIVESPPQPTPDEPAPAPPDRSHLLSALDDVRREVRQIRERALEGRNIGNDYESVLHLITARAMSLTGATGAALALLTEDRMVCRATTGDPAPPLGSEVDVRSGLSGECIRSGLVVTCEDTEADLRVDPKVCRAFRIGSFMAAPIFVDFRVAGLLEVFSPYPHSFATVHASILQRLVELIPHIEKEKTEPGQPELNTREPVPLQHAELVSSPPDPAESIAILAEERELPDLPSPGRRSHLVQFVLLVLVLGTIAMVMGYLLAPAIQKHWLTKAESSQSSNPSPEPSTEKGSLQTLPAASLQNTADRRSHPISPDDVRKLANQGDAEAQWQLGTLYHDGTVVPKDDAQAVQWFQRAAEQGYVRAQAALGSYYWAGRGVPQDYSKAYFWSQLALAQGDQNSKMLLEGLSTQMTQSQVTRARQEAELWLQSHTQGTKPNPGVK